MIEVKGYNNNSTNRSVFLDVQTKTPNFEKIENGVRYKNSSGYPTVKQAFEEKPTHGTSVRNFFYQFLLHI